MSGSAVSFRDARAADAGAVAALHADSWRRFYRGADADAFLDRDVLAERHWGSLVDDLVDLGRMSVNGDRLTRIRPRSRGFSGALANVLSGRCADGPSSSTVSGVQLRQWGCGDGTKANQRWTFVASAAVAGKYRVVNVTTGLCLSDRDGSTADGFAAGTTGGAGGTIRHRLDDQRHRPHDDPPTVRGRPGRYQSSPTRSPDRARRNDRPSSMSQLNR